MSEQYEYVNGVDTHASVLVAAATGALLAHAEFPTSPAGLSRAQSWLQRVSERATLIVVEHRVLRRDRDRAVAACRAVRR